MKKPRRESPVTVPAKRETVPAAVWVKIYNGVVHFSATKKDGFTEFVPKKFALALFLREQLRMVEQ